MKGNVMSSKHWIERSNILYTFHPPQSLNKSEYDVSDNDNPEFVPKGYDSWSSDGEGGPSGNEGAKSSTSARASNVKRRKGKGIYKKLQSMLWEDWKGSWQEKTSERDPLLV